MKLFVWDLHGVLESGNERAVMHTSNKVLDETNFSERFDIDAINRNYGKKWWEYFEELLPERPFEFYMKMQEACVARTLGHPEVTFANVKPTGHAHYVLGEIQKKHKQILISNIGPEGLLLFLRVLHMKGVYFDETFAVEGNGFSKRRALEDFLADKSFEGIVTIGDSPSDMELKRIKPNSVSYLYAHPGRAFRECEADYRIRDLREVLREL